MSQKKVDQYKKDKANRKKIIAKQKREALLLKLAGIVITLAFIGFIGSSVYFKWFKEDEAETVATYALSDKEVSSAFEAYTATTEESSTDEANSQSNDDTDNVTESGEDSTTDSASSETTTTP